MSLRTRDIMQLEKELAGKVPPELFKALIKFAEDNAAMKQMMLQLASTQDKVLDLLGQQIRVSETMKSLMPHIQREREANVGISTDPTITGEIGEDDPR